ncbi:hypothetical protein M011DRAFT_482284 [Sporormia fimetaria CBS 119925]|uniref:Uncharacterized protein n=1 Tax=Sporormia fimetaria CBS 119925 TaxID=1340428 RepID=A0A6A6UV85_9PLEO|nr:hypothetical protein M011DRAFT_482284 [Sporormia fimetaria CBS 119925]
MFLDRVLLINANERRVRAPRAVDADEDVDATATEVIYISSDSESDGDFEEQDEGYTNASSYNGDDNGDDDGDGELEQHLTDFDALSPVEPEDHLLDFDALSSVSPNDGDNADNSNNNDIVFHGEFYLDRDEPYSFEYRDIGDGLSTTVSHRTQSQHRLQKPEVDTYIQKAMDLRARGVEARWGVMSDSLALGQLGLDMNGYVWAVMQHVDKLRETMKRMEGGMEEEMEAKMEDRMYMRWIEGELGKLREARERIEEAVEELKRRAARGEIGGMENGMENGMEDGMDMGWTWDGWRYGGRRLMSPEGTKGVNYLVAFLCGINCFSFASTRRFLIQLP